MHDFEHKVTALIQADGADVNFLVEKLVHQSFDAFPVRMPSRVGVLISRITVRAMIRRIAN